MLASYTIVRWDTNLRVSAILGLVGGGGLGQAVYNNVQLGFYGRLGTLLLVIYGLGMISELIGDTVFRRSAAIWRARSKHRTVSTRGFARRRGPLAAVRR